MSDLISRSALLEKIGMSNYSSIDPYDQRGKIFKMVAMFPAVDAEPVRHGRWDEPYPNDIWDCYKCSCCGYTDDKEYNFCPNCGAKMDDKEEA